jgi:hypothetical protein
VDQIQVDWPDGPPETSSEVFPGTDVDRVVILERGKGKKR